MSKSGGRTDGLTLGAALDSTKAIVLVVRPSCGVCNDPSLPAAWEAIVQGFSDQGQDVYRIGVVTSSLAGDGLTFLRRFGEFHEVIAGGGWAGLGSLHYLFRDLGGPAGVPQVVVLDRQVTRQTSGVSVIERVVRRHVGLGEILDWANHFRQAEEISSGEAGGPDQ